MVANNVEHPGYNGLDFNFTMVIRRTKICHFQDQMVVNNIEHPGYNELWTTVADPYQFFYNPFLDW